MSQQLHEVRFVWPHDAKDVIVMGSYDNWSSNTRLTKGPRGWEAVVMVKWGTKILYKFVVDGRWAISDSAPTETDWSGNLNNVYYSPHDPAGGAPEPPAAELASPAAAGAVPGAAAFRPSADIATEATEAATSTVSAVAGTVQAGVASVAQAAQTFAEKLIDQSAVTPITTPAANADKAPVLNGTAADGSTGPTGKVEEAKAAVVKAANGIVEETKVAIPESLVADKPPPVPAEAIDPASSAPTTRSPNMPIVPLGHPVDAGAPPASTSVPETTVVPGAAVAASTPTPAPEISPANEASTHAPVNFNKGTTSPSAAEDKPLVPEVKEAEAPITEAKPAPAPPVESAPTPELASTPTPVRVPVPAPVSVEPIKTAEPGAVKPTGVSRPTTPKKEANGNGTTTPTKQIPSNGTNGTSRPPPPVTPVTPQRGSIISNSYAPDTPVSTKSTKSSKYDSTNKRSSFFGKIKHIFQGDEDKEKKHSRSVSGSGRS